MNVREAVTARIKELCDKNHMTINTLSNTCGMPPSTIYSIFRGKSQNPSVNTVYQICEGLNITLAEFFDNEIFYEDKNI